MIDKLDLRVPRLAGFSAEFQRLYQDLRNDPKGPFKPSKHYTAVADLRRYGYPCVLHTFCNSDKEGNHKLEVIDAGLLGYSRMQAEIARVFAVDSRRLGLMRLDLAADVHGVSVNWFEQHVIAKWKRYTCSYGRTSADFEFCEMGRRGVETFYAGRRPCLFRIYDKIAELLHQHARMVRRLSREARANCPSFEETSGYPETLILTRVERQFGGGRLPVKLATFGALRRAAEVNPFEPLILTAAGAVEPNPRDHDLTRYLAGMQLRSMVQRQGIHRVKQWINKHSTRNGSRYLETYAQFLPAVGEGITSERLLERYRESVSRQLAA